MAAKLFFTIEHMKLLFCHDDPEVTERLAQCPSARQNILVPCCKGSDLLQLVAATEPHLIAIGGNCLGATAESLRLILLAAGCSIPIFTLPVGQTTDEDLDGLWLALESKSIELKSQQDGIGSAVLVEEPFDAPKQAESADSEDQENRLLNLLWIGATKHSKAKAYMKKLLSAEETLPQVAPAVLAQGPVGYLWRTQLFRYIGVLAHYVPGVDTQSLPRPCPILQRFHFVHRSLSGEAYYGMCALRHFGFDPVFETALWEIGQFQTAAGLRVCEEVARLKGWTDIFRQVAVAHVALLDSVLAQPGQPSGSQKPAILPVDETGTFCRFWRLSRYVNESERIRELAGEVLSGRKPESVRPFSSFFEFVEGIQEQNTSFEWN